MNERNVNIHNLERVYAWLGDQISQNVYKPRNEGSIRKMSTESVKEMLEESKEMNNGNEKKTRKRRSK